MEMKKESLGYLQPSSEITFTEEAGIFDPQKFYRSGKNIHIGEGFEGYILSLAEGGSHLSKSSIKSFNLVKSADDKRVQLELPKGYVFENLNMFCTQLGVMLTSEIETKKGNLISNGHANLFYVRGEGIDIIAVDVRQYVGTKVWYLRAVHPSNMWWHDGLRVFSAS